MLIIRDLTLAYGDAIALDHVSMDAQAGQITAVVGGNGAGKTSLIRTVAGILTPLEGRIWFEDREITGLPTHVLCEMGIGQVAEGRQIFPRLSVHENLVLGAWLNRAHRHRRATMDRVLSIFPRLAERLDQAAGTLSGGEQQMLAIGRCLMSLPKLILLDEPSQGLAPALAQMLFGVIGELRREGGLTVVLVEQNVAAALRLADQAYVLETGRFVQSGPCPALMADPTMKTAYLGL